MPLVQGRSLYLLTSSPACYHWTTGAPYIWQYSGKKINTDECSQRALYGVRRISLTQLTVLARYTLLSAMQI